MMIYSFKTKYSKYSNVTTKLAALASSDVVPKAGEPQIWFAWGRGLCVLDSKLRRRMVASATARWLLSVRGSNNGGVSSENTDLEHTSHKVHPLAALPSASSRHVTAVDVEAGAAGGPG